MANTTRLKEIYLRDVAPEMKKKFGYQNLMEIPRLEKITLNMGLGEAVQNVKILDSAAEELSIVAGQKAVITKARRSIAAFKLREGMPIGVMVTLRRDRMYEFFDKLVNVALPRVRDFRGVSGKAFDGRGNYALGIREQIIFPEINFDKIDKIKGLNIAIVTTAKTDEEGKELLRLLGMPFRN
ncbi:MAG: 50S ribosomal protein L5 [Deltaproteobacteria bacterium]|jgi:large subunit ribosomal protein L5|nr:MAG: 50S ribosomal protein L5 [Deltaproteobacteria bacterium]